VGIGLEFLIPLGLVLVAVGALVYWAVVLSEGVYLGPQVVISLYDRAARRYDDIKNVNPRDDARFLARPLLLALAEVEQPCVLDVAAGTGRLSEALLSQDDFGGRVLGIDRSGPMLAQAQRKLARHEARAGLALAAAERLPFPDASFDAVACVEALEFLASPVEALGECARVLKAGGFLLATNRVGWDALWFPGRPCGRGRVEAQLRRLGLEDVEREPWQVHYDLVWARAKRDEAGDP
jgi:SAM-dependent methyltransferase